MSVLAMTGEGSNPEEQAIHGHLVPDEKPPTSRIEVESTGSERVWRIPAKGGCSFILIFATAWLVICAVFITLMLAAGPADDGEPPSWRVWAFFSIFPFVGLGLLYGGLLMTRARHTVRVDAAEFVHERHFLGRTKRKSWMRERIQSVELVVFYTENDKPVYGIEVRGGGSRIRFGSALDAMEKVWLCQDLRIALGLAKVTTPEDREHWAAVMRQPPVRVPDPRGPKRIHIEHTSNGCVVEVPPPKFGWILMVIGSFVLAVAAFMLSRGIDMWIPNSEEMPGLFKLVGNTFMLFWCTGVGLVTVAATVLIAMGWRVARTRQQITASRHGLRLETRTGSRVLETVWEAHAVRDVCIERAGTPNHQATPRENLRAIIVVPDRVHGFGLGHSHGDLEAAAAALLTALGRPPTPEAC